MGSRETEVDSAEEIPTGSCDADKKQSERRANRCVDTILDRREDGNEDGGKPNDELKG